MDKNAEEWRVPLEITEATNGYLFLSESAQDDIRRSYKKKMKCLPVGTRSRERLIAVLRSVLA